MEGEWLCYRGVVSLMLGGQFNGVRMVMLCRWTVMEENGYVTEVVSLMEGKSHVRFNGGRMVMLWRWPV